MYVQVKKFCIGLSSSKSILRLHLSTPDVDASSPTNCVPTIRRSASIRIIFDELLDFDLTVDRLVGNRTRLGSTVEPTANRKFGDACMSKEEAVT